MRACSEEHTKASETLALVGFRMLCAGSVVDPALVAVAETSPGPFGIETLFSDCLDRLPAMYDVGVLSGPMREESISCSWSRMVSRAVSIRYAIDHF